MRHPSAPHGVALKCSSSSGSFCEGHPAEPPAVQRCTSYAAGLASPVGAHDARAARARRQITQIQMKIGFAFVEYGDYKDCDDAIRKLNGARPQARTSVVAG